MGDLELRVLECRTGLMVYQERILAKHGKYDMPETKEEALNMEPVVPKNALEALKTLSEAHTLLVELYDLAVSQSTRSTQAMAKVWDKEIEISKMRTELNKLKKQNEEFSKAVFDETN